MYQEPLMFQDLRKYQDVYSIYRKDKYIVYRNNGTVVTYIDDKVSERRKLNDEEFSEIYEIAKAKRLQRKLDEEDYQARAAEYGRQIEAGRTW